MTPSRLTSSRIDWTSTGKNRHLKNYFSQPINSTIKYQLSSSTVSISIYLLCVYDASQLHIRGRGRFAGSNVYGNIIIIIFSVAKSICVDLCYLVIERAMLIVVRWRTLLDRRYMCESILRSNVVG